MLVIGYIWQLTRMSLRERLHAFLGPTMLAIGFYFMFAPIHFNATVERVEREMKEEYSSLISQVDQHSMGMKSLGNRFDENLGILIGTARGMRENNDAAAYTFLVCGVLTALSTPWKFRKQIPCRNNLKVLQQFSGDYLMR